MANAKITITFQGVINVGAVLNISDSFNTTPLNETFVTTRQANGQCTINNGQIGVQAKNYHDAFVLDYFTSGLYSTQLSGNVVTIQAENWNSVFTVISNTVGPSISVVITPRTGNQPIELTDTDYIESPTDPCGKMLIKSYTNVLADWYKLRGITYFNNTANPIEWEAIRGEIAGLIVYNTVSGTDDQTTYLVPDSWNMDNATYQINNSPNGATVVITLNASTDNFYYYSLDGITWQTSNTFTGLLPGPYTMYAKDTYGCQHTDEFEVSAFAPYITITNPFSYLADCMSIRFKRLQEWNDFDIFRNDSNTLSCEEATDTAYQYIQKFRNSDVIQTQFLSNYPTIDVNVIKEDGTKVPVAIENKIKFLDIADRRDCNLYKTAEGGTGVYYTNGNTYDYNTGAVTGTYALNGALPNYGAVGNYIKLDAEGWYIISAIVYNEDYNAEVLILRREFVDGQTTAEVFANYNQKNYNVYEFQLDLSLYNEQTIQVEILQNSSEFGRFDYLSEKIEVGVVGNDYVQLDWWNNSDTFVYYSTGIRLRANFPLVDFVSSNVGDIEINKTPQTTILISANNYKMKTLKVENLSTAILSQFVQAILHKQLYVNRIQYIADSTPESENIEFTNFYDASAQLVATGNVYNAEYVSGNAIESVVEVQGILKTNGKYLNIH